MEINRFTAIICVGIIIVGVSILLLLSGDEITGYSIPKPPFGTGITVIYQNETKQKISLDDVLTQINSLNSNEEKNGTFIRIHSISGLHIDMEGNAEKWLILVKQGNVTRYLVFDSNGFSSIPWSGVVTPKEINQTIILKPETLFTRYATTLKIYEEGRWNFERLDISKDIYELTLLRGGDQKSFYFTSIEGNLISSP